MEKRLNDLEQQIHGVRLEVEFIQKQLTEHADTEREAHHRIDVVEKRTDGLEKSIEATNTKIDLVQRTLTDSLAESKTMTKLQSKHYDDMKTVMSENNVYFQNQHEKMFNNMVEQNKQLTRKLLAWFGAAILIIGAFFGV